MIIPTIGRAILVYGRHANPKKDVPESASISFVHNDRLINVGGWDHNGLPFAMKSLRLVQEGDLIPDDVPHAQWMQYQKDTASGKIPPTLHATPEPK